MKDPRAEAFLDELIEEAQERLAVDCQHYNLTYSGKCRVCATQVHSIPSKARKAASFADAEYDKWARYNERQLNAIERKLRSNK